jgi:hypothetical protein
MVLVDILNIDFDHIHDSLDMDAVVVGFVPKDHVEGMNFITSMFRKLEFDYVGIKGLSDVIRGFGYIVNELSRDKIFLTVIPENTYFYSNCIESRFSDDNCVPVYVFVDVGSPFRRFYVVKVSGGYNKTYFIKAYGHERISLHIMFYEDLPTRYTQFWPINEYKRNYELIYDKELYFITTIADDETRELLSKAIALATKTQTLMKHK